MSLYRCGYNARTHRAKSWSAEHIADCEIIVLCAPGLSVARMAGALHKLADMIEVLPDPNKADTSLPVARYSTANNREEITPMQKARRNVAAVG